MLLKKNTKKSLIIFDVDGTLINSASGTIKALKETFKDVYDLQVSDSDLLKVYHHHFKTIISHFYTVHDPLKFEKAKQMYVHKSLLYSAERALFPHVYDTLKHLSKSNYIATATNLTTSHLKQMCDYFDISQFIDHIRGTDTHDNPKPSPDILNESIEMFDVVKDKSFMVGDSLSDIRAGKNAGLNTIAMCYPGNDSHYFERVSPDYIISDFKEISQIITQ